MDIISESSQQVVYVSKFVQEANNQAFGLAPNFGKVIHNGVTLNSKSDMHFRQMLEANCISLPQRP